MRKPGRNRRRIALTAAAGIVAGGLILGGSGLASPVIELVETPAAPGPEPQAVELRVRPHVDIGDLPRIVAIRPGAVVANDSRRPDGPDPLPARRGATVVPESPPPIQGVEGTRPDSPVRRPLPPPRVAPPGRPAPPNSPDILPPPTSSPALDTAPAVVVAPDQPGNSLRPDPVPGNLRPDAPPR